MDVKKIIVLLLSCSVLFFGMSLISSENSLDVDAKVNAKSNSSYELDKVILEKENELIQISFMDYIIIAGNTLAMNGYHITHLTAGDNQSYDLMDYVGYFSSGDSPDMVLQKLNHANLGGVIVGATAGEIVNGRLVVSTDESEEFELIDIE